MTGILDTWGMTGIWDIYWMTEIWDMNLGNLGDDWDLGHEFEDI